MPISSLRRGTVVGVGAGGRRWRGPVPFWEAAPFVMERTMMLTIKELAERWPSR